MHDKGKKKEVRESPRRHPDEIQLLLPGGGGGGIAGSSKRAKDSSLSVIDLDKQEEATKVS